MPTIEELNKRAEEAGGSGDYPTLPDGKYTVIIEEVKTKPFKKSTGAVSYTHLTLPTILRV